jgi:predicted transcriptional regulator
VPETTPDLVSLSADVVSAYVSNNSVPSADLPALISTVHSALVGATNGSQEPVVERLEPPISIKKSVKPDFIISMEDGKPYKSMKRHLRAKGLTPEEYRRKWGLPHDYPMVAANYAAARSEMAKRIGLGQKRRGKSATKGKRKAA